MDKQIIFSFGQNNKLPTLTSEEFFAVALQNLSPENERLEELLHLNQTHSVGVPANALAFSFDPSTRFSNVYAFATTGVHLVKDGSLTSLASLTASTKRWQPVLWKDSVYFTRPEYQLSKAFGPTISSVDTSSNGSSFTFSARYMLSAHDRLFCGNTFVNGTNNSTEVRWSDVYNPEVWEISESTEADKFSLSVSDLEITGLALHHNTVLIFSSRSVWMASYEGLPKIYSFSPLFSDTGCAYHYSCVSVGDVTYFIAKHGVYKIENYQLVEVGGDIWPTLRTALVGQTEVYATADEEHKLIYWNVGSNTYVYNYDEKRWAVYNFTYTTALLHIPGSIRRTKVIDDCSEIIDSVSTIIDDGLGTSSASQLDFLARGNFLYQPDTGTAQTYACKLTLPFAFFGDLWSEKEVNEVKLIFEQVGTPTISLTTKYKDSHSDTEKTETSTLSSFTDEAVFKLRNVRAAKLMAFELNFNQTSTNYVTRLIGLSVRIQNDEPEK